MDRIVKRLDFALRPAAKKINETYKTIKLGFILCAQALRSTVTRCTRKRQKVGRCVAKSL